MKWTLEEIIKMVLSGSFLAALFALIAKKMDWIRFKKKDKAEVDSLEVDIDSRRIDSEVKISDTIMSWGLKLMAQLEKANEANEKLKREIEAQQSKVDRMKNEFENGIESLNKMLDNTRKTCDEEKEKNRLLIIQLNSYINGSAGSK